MLDENLIATLEQSLRQTRNAQNRLVARLREAESEVEHLRLEISALENSALQTEKAIDSLLVTMRSGHRPNFGNSMTIEDDIDGRRSMNGRGPSDGNDTDPRPFRRDTSVSYFHQNNGQNRGIPARNGNFEPISNRFSDRTITQSCTLLLREAGGPLHVNELYNLLIAGGMKFKGNNPTISVAVSLSRNKRFRKVDPGTFDLIIREAREAYKAAS
jgi:hypothetical protein